MKKEVIWDYLDHSPAIPCPAGDKFRVKHKLVTEGNNLSLVEVDKIDIQANINSYEDSVSLEKMIARYRRTGDMSFLEGNKGGFYADVSGMETNPARAIDLARKVTAAVAENAAVENSVEKVDEPSQVEVKEVKKEDEGNA